VVVGVVFLVVSAAGFYTAALDHSGASRSSQRPAARADPLAVSIRSAQERLHDVPGDYLTYAVTDSTVNRHVSPDRQVRQAQAASGKGHGENGPQPIRVPTESG